MVNEGPAPNTALRARAKEALAPLALHHSQKREAWQAFLASPDGVERVAAQSQSGSPHSPAAIFLAAIRNGEHLLDHTPKPRYTGWRFVRGSHSGTYVEDPKGTDPLPAGYDFATHSRPGTPEKEREPTVVTYDEYRRLIEEAC